MNKNFFVLIFLTLGFQISAQKINSQKLNSLASARILELTNSLNAQNAKNREGSGAPSDIEQIAKNHFYSNAFIIFDEESGDIITPRNFVNDYVEGFTNITFTKVNPIYCSSGGINLYRRISKINKNLVFIDFIIINNKAYIHSIYPTSNTASCTETTIPPPIYRDSDGDGIIDPQDQCSNTPKGAEVDNVGCPYDTNPTDPNDTNEEVDYTGNNPYGDDDGDGVINDIDLCPNTPKGPEMCYSHWRKKMVKRITPYGCVDCDDDGRHPDKPTNSRYYDEDDNNFCITNTNKCEAYIVNCPPIPPCDTARFIDTIRMLKEDITDLNKTIAIQQDKLDCVAEFILRSQDSIIAKTNIAKYTKVLEDIYSDMRNQGKSRSSIANKYQRQLIQVIDSFQMYSNYPITMSCGDGLNMTTKIDLLNSTQHLLLARSLIMNWAEIDSFYTKKMGDDWNNTKVSIAMSNLSAALAKSANYDQKQEIAMLNSDLLYTSVVERKSNSSAGTSELEKTLLAIIDSHNRNDFAGTIRNYLAVKNSLHSGRMAEMEYEVLKAKLCVAKMLHLNSEDLRTLRSFVMQGSEVHNILIDKDLASRLLNDVTTFDLAKSGLSSDEIKRIELLQIDAKEFKAKYIN